MLWLVTAGARIELFHGKHSDIPACSLSRGNQSRKSKRRERPEWGQSYVSTSNLPSVTFVVAVYNSEGTIESALDSMLAQDYLGETSIIVVDDGSTDCTAELVGRYPQVTLLRHDRNQGRASARNLAIMAATSDLIAIQDADDWSYPWRLRESVLLLEPHRTAVVGGQLQWEDAFIGPYKGASWPTDEEAANVMLSEGRMPVAHPSALLPTRLMQKIGGYDSAFPVAEDLDVMLSLRALSTSLKFISTSRVVVRYSRPRRTSYKYVLRSCYWTARVHRKHKLKTPLARPGWWLVAGSISFSRTYLKSKLRRAEDGSV